MKRNILLILVPLAFLVSAAFCTHVNHHNDKEYARCVGSSPCNACSNCSMCKYCSAGGTCGACEKKKPQSTSASQQSSSNKQSAVSGQCKATTKKGTRCSRAARSGGYCWQHGG